MGSERAKIDGFCAVLVVDHRYGDTVCKKKPQHEKNNLRDAFSTLTRQNFA
jgi:hypothetical protein